MLIVISSALMLTLAARPYENKAHHYLEGVLHVLQIAQLSVGFVTYKGQIGDGDASTVHFTLLGLGVLISIMALFQNWRSILRVGRTAEQTSQAPPPSPIPPKPQQPEQPQQQQQLTQSTRQHFPNSRLRPEEEEFWQQQQQQQQQQQPPPLPHVSSFSGPKMRPPTRQADRFEPSDGDEIFLGGLKSGATPPLQRPHEGERAVARRVGSSLPSTIIPAAVPRRGPKSQEGTRHSDDDYEKRNTILMRTCVKSSNFQDRKAVLDAHFRDDAMARGDGSWMLLVRACSQGTIFDVHEVLETHFPPAAPETAVRYAADHRSNRLQPLQIQSTTRQLL
jgi:hypothetical protein